MRIAGGNPQGNLPGKLRLPRAVPGPRNVAEPLSAKGAHVLVYKIINSTLGRMCIVQEDEFGCGAACVAYVVGTTYQQTVQQLGTDEASTKGYYCRELKETLAAYGQDYSYCYAKEDTIKLARREGSIVYIRKSKAYPAGHYLVFTGGCWMDPWINFCHNKDVRFAVSGYRVRLPGKIQYILYKNSEKPLHFS